MSVTSILEGTAASLTDDPDALTYVLGARTSVRNAPTSTVTITADMFRP